MRGNQEMAMRRYSEAARAHYDQNPADETALHERDLDRLDISQGARDHIVKNALPHVAAHLHNNPDVHHSISKMDEASQIRAIQALHNSGGHAQDLEDESGQTENERVNSYLREREAAGRSRSRGTKYRGY